jgi:hypothetical protein
LNLYNLSIQSYTIYYLLFINKILYLDDMLTNKQQNDDTSMKNKYIIYMWMIDDVANVLTLLILVSNRHDNLLLTY